MVTSRTWLEEIVFALAFASVFALIRLPFELVEGSPVPSVIFKDMPLVFRAFVLCLNFAFSGAVVTMSLRESHPRAAFVCRLVAVVAMFMAGGLLAWLSFPSVSESAMVFVKIATLKNRLVEYV